MILERLDRGVASDEWLRMFPAACEKHLTAPIFDHSSLLFYVTNQQKRFCRNNRPFKFENMWMRHKGCAEVIKEGWQGMQSIDFTHLVRGVEHCGKLLTKWNRKVFGNVQVKIRMKESELEKLLINAKEAEDAIAIDTCKCELNELSVKEEILWKQRLKNL